MLPLNGLVEESYAKDLRNGASTIANLIEALKMRGPIFQNLVFCFNSKFELIRPSRLHLPMFYYVSSIIVTITRHVFINISTLVVRKI